MDVTYHCYLLHTASGACGRHFSDAPGLLLRCVKELCIADTEAISTLC